MVSKEHQEKTVENLDKINEYLTSLGIFSGNAALNHIFAENHRMKKAVLNKKYKDAIKIMDDTMKYVRELQWFPGNAALMWTLESLEKTRVLISGKGPESEITEEIEADLIKGAADYDDSTPKVESELTEEESESAKLRAMEQESASYVEDSDESE